jgi:hypothetical protein
MILFVFEGARREPMLFESIKYLFFDKGTDTIVYSFGNNIYNLYKQIMELGTGDIVSILREIHRDSKENPFKDISNSSDFAEIYLFFDYDLQHKFLSLEEINRRLRDMLKLFNDETSNGKLYINYPMIESIRYTKELPDNNYYLYTVKCAECHDFKRLSYEFCHYGNLDFILIDRHRTPQICSNVKNCWEHLKIMNVSKANYICTGNNTMPLAKNDIAQNKIFDAQLQKYINRPVPSVAILNAFPLFIYDYFKV